MAELRLSGSRLIVRGNLDEDAEFEMRDRCRELLTGSSGPVTVDLSKAGGMSSMCIGTLVALWIDLREAGRAGKIVPSPSVMRMFEMTGLDAVLLKPPAAGRLPEAGEGGGDESTGSDDGAKDGAEDGAKDGGNDDAKDGAKEDAKDGGKDDAKDGGKRAEF